MPTSRQGENRQTIQEFCFAEFFSFCTEKYQLDRQTGYRWLQEFKADGEKAFERKELVPGDELKEAQKRIKELETENRILKKATAYFAELNSK